VTSEQRTFASLTWQAKSKVTRRERFLVEMERGDSVGAATGTDRAALPKAGKGRQPLGLEKILRIIFLQHRFNLLDPQAEDAI
jgi:IS5 family transposase